MKRFFKKLLFILPIPVIIVLINYFEDPANLFNVKYEKGIVEYLVQGYNVTNVVNYNDRMLQKLFIKKMKDCPTEIVLGASGVFLIDSSFSTDTHFINNGMGGASFEDYLAIFYLYEKKGCKIQKVVIGLSPYLLNDNLDQDRWKSLSTEYNTFLKKVKSYNLKIKYQFEVTKMSEDLLKIYR